MVSVDVKHHVYYLPGVHVPGESGTNGIVKGVQGAQKGNDRTSSPCNLLTSYHLLGVVMRVGGGKGVRVGVGGGGHQRGRGTEGFVKGVQDGKKGTDRTSSPCNLSATSSVGSSDGEGGGGRSPNGSGY